MLIRSALLRTGLAGLGLLASTAGHAAVIGSLEGSTTTPQVQMGPEWFSRFDAGLITTAQFDALKSQSSTAVNLYATSDTVKVTYVGTGAARDSNLFLAAAGSFDASAFWNPIYASGGTNNLASYNPVSAGNELFQTRAGCSYAAAKAGNTCLASEVGQTREISGLAAGELLVFGLQALQLTYAADGISLPNVEYYFSGPASNNADAKGWDDGALHAKLFDLGDGRMLVGFEDTWLGSGSKSDRDYNDMVFLFEGVSTQATPEPATLALLLGALGALGFSRRRSKRD